MKIHAIPGFMGHKTDYHCFNISLLSPITIEDYDTSSLNNWGQSFNQQLDFNQSTNPILVGYSMGGRLALHALIAEDSRWSGAIIISCHPGLKSEKERRERLNNDTVWAKRFEREDWTVLMSSWNQQETLKNGFNPFLRRESDYNREKLSQQLLHFSLGHQENLEEKIEKLSIPILWITGENDKKFSELGRNLKFYHPESKHILFPQSGHRCIWENPPLFNQAIENFVKLF